VLRPIDSPASWRPTADSARLHARATALAAAREFLSSHRYLEIETPTLVSTPVSDPQLANLSCQVATTRPVSCFLHTSPEYHMKRLLAAGAPDIFQLCKVYRDGESGLRHLPEFTLVEWYRHGNDYDRFISEATDFVAAVAASLGVTTPAAVHLGYRDVFDEFAGCDPLEDSVEQIGSAARRLLGERLAPGLAAQLGEERDAWLDLMMIEVIEPGLAGRGLVILDRFPASQAALARLDPADPRVSRRFEIYLHGIELANGYHELASASEQRRRFEADNVARARLGRSPVPLDEELLAALEAGLPECCGVALGFDRLLMACLGERNIRRVVSFPPGS